MLFLHIILLMETYLCNFLFLCPLQAEMEMVAGGLKKNLQVAERVHLLSLYRSICTAGNIRTAAEALGLVSNSHDP